MKHHLRPIRRQVLLFTVLICATMLVAVGAALFFHHLGQTRAHLADSLRSTARIIAANSTVALAFRDTANASDILASLRHHPLIVSAVLYDLEGRAFVTYGRPLASAPAADDSSVLVDVVNQGETLGRLLLVADNAPELRRTALTWASFYAGALALTTLLAFALAARFQRAVATPLAALADTARHVTTRRDYSLRATPGGPAEVAALADTFNTMLVEIGRRDEALARQLLELDQEIRERQAAQDTLRLNTRELLRLSREAGMAEVATGVLHNIGNALNSINVSAELLADQIRTRAAPSATALRDFFQTPPPQALAALAAHPDGDELRRYSLAHARHASASLDLARAELASLQAGVAHLKDIVVRQQSLAKKKRLVETFDLAEAVEEALLIDKTAGHASLPSLRIAHAAEPHASYLVHTDRTAVVQIIINLLANARAALAAASPESPVIGFRLSRPAPDRVSLAIHDNGVGIAPDQLVSIFSFGFTTKAGGHGFGLHNAANTARLLDGELRVHSDGPGRGATFTLELPCPPPAPQS